MEGSIERSRSVWLGSAAIVAVGLIVGGYLLGNGLVRARAADRSVTVRGLAERNVTADLATWNLSYAEQGSDLAEVQAAIARDTQAARAYFARLGFPAGCCSPPAQG